MNEKIKKQILVLAGSCIVLLLLIILFSGVSSGEHVGNNHSFAVYFTEVLASNSLYPDSQGHTYDYVEICNSADGDIDISGYKLTDSQKTVRYTVPNGTVLKAGQYLVIWCDAESEEDTVAGFSISKSGGEVIYLMNRKNVVIDTVETLPSKKNIPMILQEDGTWTLGSYATPGFENTRDGYDAYTESRSAEGYSVFISEVLSSNTSCPSPDGEYRDFIEIYNPSDTDADLSGCRLTDDPDEIKYQFPEGSVLSAGEYLVCWCGIDLPFNISSEGETLYLQSPSGDLIDREEIPALESGTSCQYSEKGNCIVSSPATPGFANTEEGYNEYLDSLGLSGDCIVITEVMAENAGTLMVGQDFPDWIEIHNAGSSSVSLAGWGLSDSEDDPFKWVFPEYTLDPDEYLLVFCDGTNSSEDGCFHTDFSLSRLGETLNLTMPSGITSDTFVMVQAETDMSQIRNSEETVENTDLVTPGYANTTDGYLLWQSSLTVPSDLMISEVMTSNNKYLQQSDNKYYDWVELYNHSDHTISLSDYSLTDDTDNSSLLMLPDMELAAGEYTVIVLKNSPLKLNASDDRLYLYNQSVLIDAIHLKGIPYESSMGRCLNEGGFFYFSDPTPGSENLSGSRMVSEAPEASLTPGIYNDVTSITVSLSVPGNTAAAIYYTTDGSWPTADDEEYTVPFELTSTTVIRAVCIEEGHLPSETVTLGYFINEEHTLPIVSLNCNYEDLFGSGGIYTNYYSDMEKYANVSYYDTDGSTFELDCGLQLFGSLSREIDPKKSFKVNFRACYGQSVLNFPLYEDSDVSEFHSLVLRASEDYPLAFIREEMMTSLAQDSSEDLMTVRSRYCILYVNGSYFGIYALKEAFSSDYYAAHMDYPEETCRCVRVINVLNEAPDLYELMEYCSSHDMTVQENYDYVLSKIDEDSLIDWVIFEAYCANSDILNNVRYLYSSEDDQWRWAFYDLDWCMYYQGASYYPLEEGEQFSMIPRHLLENEDFRGRFLTRLSELLQTTLSDENVLQRIDELADSIRAEMPRERERWDGSVSGWEDNLDVLRTFVTGRAADVAWDFSNYFGLSQEEKDQYFKEVLP